QWRKGGGAKGWNTRSGKQIDRVPDAILNNIAIRHCKNRHRCTAGEPADNSSRVTMYFEGNAHPVAGLAVLQVADAARRHPDRLRPAVRFVQPIDALIARWGKIPEPAKLHHKTESTPRK